MSLFNPTTDCLVCGFDHTCAHCSGIYKSWLRICPKHPALQKPSDNELRTIEMSLR